MPTLNDVCRVIDDFKKSVLELKTREPLKYAATLQIPLLQKKEVEDFELELTSNAGRFNVRADDLLKNPREALFSESDDKQALATIKDAILSQVQIYQASFSNDNVAEQVVAQLAGLNSLLQNVSRDNPNEPRPGRA
jgi:hypothetical protein